MKRNVISKRWLFPAVLVVIILSVTGCTGQKEESKPVIKEKMQLVAKHYFSGFDLAHDTYNAISPASDGRIYYCLSSQSIDTGGQLYVYDPSADKVEHLGDLTELCGEAGIRP